jgi:DNA modification methylase
VTPYYQHAGITIYHGDCREILSSVQADAIITDPPYGIDLDTDYTRFKGQSLSRTWNRVQGDAGPFDPSPWLAFPVAVLFGANYFMEALPCGKWLVWNKRDDGPSRVLADGELAWHNGPGKSVRVFNWFWVGCYRRGEMAQPVSHPTQKPVELMKWCIQEIAPTGVILDPYMGSGTTLVAAKQLGRQAIGIELEERYCEIAATRLSQDMLPFTVSAPVQLAAF